MCYLEVFTKRPISKHLKVSMMIDILANIIKVIVLSTCTNTLLAVDSSHQSPQVTVRLNGSQEDRLELKPEKSEFTNIVAHKLFISPIQHSIPMQAQHKLPVVSLPQGLKRTGTCSLFRFIKYICIIVSFRHGTRILSSLCSNIFD